MRCRTRIIQVQIFVSRYTSVFVFQQINIFVLLFQLQLFSTSVSFPSSHWSFFMNTISSFATIYQYLYRGIVAINAGSVRRIDSSNHLAPEHLESGQYSHFAIHISKRLLLSKCINYIIKRGVRLKSTITAEIERLFNIELISTYSHNGTFLS